jgi:hypothetical protein
VQYSLSTTHTCHAHVHAHGIGLYLSEITPEMF